jgi:hypothetical protein
MKNGYNSIEKENIDALIFTYQCDGQQNQLKPILKKGEILGNGYKHKIKIGFHAIEGKFEVDTTIWATTEKYIVLKGGVSIPIQCIEYVRL